jgi:hypothetical protein
VVSVDGVPGVNTRARTRDDVPTVARKAIAVALEVDEGSFDLSIAVEERRRVPR